MPDASGFDVVVLAAGKGVRMRSRLPKVLHRLCGETLVKRVLRAVCSNEACAPSHAVVVVGFEADQVRVELAALQTEPAFSSVKIVDALQAEQNGTGHAAQIGLAALPEGDRPVLILPGDVPLLTAETVAQAIESFRAGNAELVFLSCNHPNPSGFGRIIRDSQCRPTGIVEDKDCSPEQRAIQEINSSIYIVGRSFLKEALAALKNNNVQREYYLTDIVSYGVRRGSAVEGLVVADYQELSGANSRSELSALETIGRRRINQRWMDSGVTMEDPESTYIDDSAVIGAECWIGAGSRIYGRTVLGSGTVIEGNSVIRDSFVAENVRIKFSCVIDSSKVGAATQIGPFAHLRPDSELGPEVRIGNFVETKKSRFGKGAKANHLSYIGDAQVGAKSNIGAGTITCNYDGWNKSKTVVGDGAFIGSNSVLVAPVTVGAGSFVAAGSAVTVDVPPEALAIARSHQVTKEGWAGKRRERMEKEKAEKKNG